ncbi:MAG: FAD-binding oxidoreductase [Gammaproteobacteria bacterium]|nr:FAD-binding oxidoreductase [Gammaproteobacteria bacterium]
MTDSGKHNAGWQLTTMMNRRDFVTKGLGLAASLSATPLVGAEASKSPQKFNIAIIGAGLLGSAAARHLTQVTDDVALIGPGEPANRKTHTGVFASHYDASRLIRVVDPDLVWATLAKRSLSRHREIERESGIKFRHDIGYMMVTPGGLGKDWFNLPAMREVADDLQVDIEDLDDGALKQRFPYLSFTPGSSAVLQEDDAGYLDPRRLIEAQHQISIAQGASVIRDVVVDLRSRAGHVEVRTKSGSRIRANRVLLATGAYTNASGLLQHRLQMYIRAAMIMASEVAPAMNVKYPATLYAKTDGAEDFWGLLMPPITYDDGRSYIKTMDGYYGERPLEGFDQLGAWSRSNGHEEHHEVLRRALREVFPSVEVLSREFQPCLIADTASRYPYIDMIDERLGIVVGGNGKSGKSCDEIGRLAADMIHNAGWASSLPQSLFSARFS